jgi:4-hydroxy-tetrahydrodipicolinate synthase
MSQSKSLLRGAGVALVSLFDKAGILDVAATVGHAETLVSRGVRAVLLAGTTGEFWALTDADRVNLVKAARAALPSDVQVMAGTGANDAATAARLTADAVEAGADAVLVLPPRGATDVLDYYNAVAGAAAGRPVLGYHMPLLSAPGLAVDQLNELPIQGIKDSSLDPRRLLAELDLFKGDIYTGVDSLLSYAGPLGCAGSFGALANIEPELSVAAFSGDATAQRRLAPIERAALEQFPVGLKALMHTKFGTSTALGRGTAEFLRGAA